MDILVIVFLVCATLGLLLSIVTTVKLFKDFTAEETPEGRIERLKKYRTRMILTYAATAGFVTAAAAVKIIA